MISPASAALRRLVEEANGEPRAARQIVAREMLNVLTTALAPVGGGDLALLGEFNRSHTGPSRRSPYDAFLMRIRRDTPSGATLVVDSTAE